MNRFRVLGITNRQGADRVRFLQPPWVPGKPGDGVKRLSIKRLAAVMFSSAVVLSGAAVWVAPAAGAASGGMVSVTFDDGWASQYNNALPVLNKYGVPATMYILSGSLNDVPNYMTQAQVQAFASRGDEIAAHTVTHRDLTTLTPAEVDTELTQSKTTLQQMFGPSAAVDFASPYGAYNPTTTAAVQKYYATQRNTDGGFNAQPGFDPYNILVQNVESTTTTATVQGWIDSAKANNTWLVLVYHEVGANIGGDIYHVDTAVLDSHMAAVKNSGLAMVTVRQGVQALSPSPTPTPTPTPAPGPSKRLNDFNGDGKTDLIARDASGELWLYPGTGTGDWLKRIDLGAGWNVMSTIVSAGDFNGDGKADVIARDKSGELWFYPGTGTGDWSTRQNLGAGWNTMTSIVAPGDFNGDGKADVIARDTSGELWLYPNNGAGDWFKRVDLGSGWNIMTSIAAPGDFNNDGNVDLVARDASGEFWLYPGNGKNEWFKRVDLGAGWNTMNAITAPGDMNSDGRPDVIARDSTGELWLYPNNGTGDWFKRIDLGSGWTPMTAIL